MPRGAYHCCCGRGRACLTSASSSLRHELAKEMEKYKTITEELELTFAEMSGY